MSILLTEHMPRARDRRRGSAQTRYAALLMITLLLQAGAARAADVSPVFSVQAQVTHDSNFNRAAATADQASDLFQETLITYGRRYQLSSYNRFAATVDVKTEFHADYTRLNNLQIGLNASFSRRFGLGARVPWLRVGIGATRLEYRENLRDGMQYSGDIAVGKNLSDQLGVIVSHSRQSRTARGNDAYNGNGYTTAVTVNYAHDSGLRLSAGYAQRYGDVTFHCSNAFAPPAPVAREYTFDQYAYRRTSRTRLTSLNLNYPISDSATVFLGYERQDTTWFYKSYPNDILRVGLAKRYQ